MGVVRAPGSLARVLGVGPVRFVLAGAASQTHTASDGQPAQTSAEQPTTPEPQTGLVWFGLVWARRCSHRLLQRGVVVVVLFDEFLDHGLDRLGLAIVEGQFDADLVADGQLPLEAHQHDVGAAAEQVLV